MSGAVGTNHGGQGGYRLTPGSGYHKAWMVALAVGVVGLGASAAGMAQDSKRFAYSYLFAFFVFLTMGLGALFFVMIQYITKGSWSVTVRRTAEAFMAGLPVFVLLVAPLIINAEKIYPWMQHHGAHGAAHEGPGQKGHGGGLPLLAAQPMGHGAPHAAPPGAPTVRVMPEHGGRPAPTSQAAENQKRLVAAQEREHGHIMASKSWYLTKPSFIGRAVLFVLAWAFLAWRFFSWSTSQDTSRDVATTKKAQALAPIGLMIFAVSLTLSAIDWIKSLDPVWYSTIFGVHVFAGAVVVALAMVILTTLALRGHGLGDAVNVEHYHDLGKLLFGFNCFWAYVTFSEFFLIWYSNIPEELAFFHRRWTDNGGTWKNLSLALPIVHFAVPFWFLMSRNVKRRLGWLALGSVLLVCTHIAELYWLIFPNLGALHVHWMDVTCLLGVGGLYLALVFRTLASHPLIPVGDPRLKRALTFQNA